MTIRDWPPIVDRAGDRRLRGRRLVGGHEHQADAVLRRKRKLLRLEVLAVHVGAGFDWRARGYALEFGAAILVGLHRERLAAALHLHRLADQVVRQLAANHADRHGARRQIVHRTRDAGHLLRVGHLELRGDRQLRWPDTNNTKHTEHQNDSFSWLACSESIVVRVPGVLCVD